MTEQPLALKLAEQLEDTDSARLHLLPYAAELRRLHEENQGLKTLVRNGIETVRQDEYEMEMLRRATVQQTQENRTFAHVLPGQRNRVARPSIER